jgi:hypothetical protein
VKRQEWHTMEISWIHLVILILASFRLTHLIVYDKITEFIRNPFIEVTSENDENGETRQAVRVKGEGFQHWLGTLLTCYWCTGVWSSLAVVIVYLYVPILFPVLLILAIAGAAAIIENWIP